MSERFPKSKEYATAIAAAGALVLTGCGTEQGTTPSTTTSTTQHKSPSAPKSGPNTVTPPEHPNATNPASFRNGDKAVICDGILALVTGVDQQGKPSRYHVYGRPVVSAPSNQAPYDVSISRSGFDVSEIQPAGDTQLWFTTRGKAFEEGQHVVCKLQTIATRQAIQPNGSGPYVITTSGETDPARFNLDAAALHAPYEVAGWDVGDVSQVALDQILDRAAGDPRP